MSIQATSFTAVGDSWEIITPSKDIFEGRIFPADSKIVEYILPLFEQEIDCSYESQEEDPYYKKELEDGESDAFAQIKDKVSSTVDSDIHSDKPKDEEALDEIKELLCAEPDTVSIQKAVCSASEGLYDLQYNYPRIRELLLEKDKFEGVLLLLALAADEERDRMEAVLFRFAMTFDEKEVAFALAVEEEVPLIQKRLKQSVRKIKSRDKKRAIILGLKPEKSTSPFLESFFQKSC